MPRRILGHVRHNVVAYLALFFALTGSAVAVSGEIKSSRQIKKGVVNSGDVRNNSLTSGDLRNGRGVRLSDFTSTALAGRPASGLGRGGRRERRANRVSAGRATAT